MESLNRSLSEYGKLLKETNLQKAYKGLMHYVKLLRTHFKDKYPEYEVSANFYQGYMDVTFFSLTSKLAKEKDLKYIVVFKHDKMQFEVWLSGKNRVVMSEYHEKFSKYQLKNYFLTSDEKGMASIVGTVLVENPDFDNLPALTKQIDAGVISFIKNIEKNYLTND
ncbi:DUF7000 family protein [Lacticigenium naphthae]|uniref:DUF7000 family protein n=1 Tax=Lacticigenium naphthae TaxID=515351 RepID=UPI0004136720|nr:hypothetical protein [Lacticigenium naphthae]